MALNDITFVKGQGGLGRALPGEDYVSGMLFYTGSLPSGFSSSDRVKKILSVEQAESLGIVDTYTDETKATSTVTITVAGTTGDTINLTMTEPLSVSVNLGTYTKTATESTVTLVAAAIKAIVNAGTLTHGYTADNVAGVLTITNRAGLGAYSLLLTTTIVGSTLAATTVQPSGGVASLLAIYHYHISEFFRIQPKGVLWTGFYAVPSPYTFTEIQTMQVAATGAIRQLGVYKNGAAFATANITTIQSVCDTLSGLHMPLSVLYCADISAVTDLSTLTTLTSLDSENVSAVISQDGAGTGALLWAAYGKSITTMGATLGAIAFASVSEDIAWIAKFNMTDGVELDTLSFANGQLLTAISTTLHDTINSQRYIFMRKFTGIQGSYHNDSHCATLPSSDYAYIENNRTIDKAIRGVYSSLLPQLAGPLQLNADGTLSDTTIAYFESQGKPNLDQMVRDGELSAYSVTIDPAQDVLSTSTVIVAVGLLPKGVARMITVNIGFVKSV